MVGKPRVRKLVPLSRIAKGVLIDRRGTTFRRNQGAWGSCVGPVQRVVTECLSNRSDRLSRNGPMAARRLQTMLRLLALLLLAACTQQGNMARADGSKSVRTGGGGRRIIIRRQARPRILGVPISAKPPGDTRCPSSGCGR